MATNAGCNDFGTCTAAARYQHTNYQEFAVSHEPRRSRMVPLASCWPGPERSSEESRLRASCDRRARRRQGNRPAQLPFIVLGLTSPLLLGLSPVAAAAEGASGDRTVEELIVTGVRGEPRSLTDST